MKKIGILVSVIILSLYATLWMVAANHFKNDTKNFLESLNHKSWISVEYGDIGISGFPLRIGASVKDLKLVVESGQLLAMLPSGFLAGLSDNNAKGEKLASIIESSDLTETYRFIDPMEISSNLLGQQFEVSYERLDINIKEGRHEANIKNEGSQRFTLKLHTPAISTLIAGKSLLYDLSLNNIKLIESLSFQADQSRLYQPTGNTELSAIDGSLFKLSLDMNNTPNKIDFYGNTDNQVYHQAFLDTFSILPTYHALFEALDINSIVLASSKGESMTIDMSFILPHVGNLIEMLQAQTIPVDKIISWLNKKISIELHQFKVHSGLGKVELIGKVNFDLKQQQIKLKSKGKLKATENGYQHIQSKFVSILQEEEALRPLDPVLKNWLQENQILLKQLYPKIHEFETSFAIDLNLQRNNKNQFRVSIPQLALDMGNNGIRLSGETSFEKEHEYILELKQYKSMLNNFLEYSHRFFSLTNTLPQGLMPQIDILPGAGEKLIETLESIADKKDGQTLTFHVNVSELQPPSNNILEKISALSQFFINYVRIREIPNDLHGKRSGNSNQPVFTDNERDTAIKALYYGDYQKVLNWAQPKADKGDVMAQFILGSMYFKGTGVNFDLEKAAIWFEKAAEKNHQPSINNLGVLYAQGKGVKKDLARANSLFKSAKALHMNIADLNIKALQSQAGYPALIIYIAPQHINVVCEHYNEASIDNLMQTSKDAGLKSMGLLSPNEPHSIPLSLREYAFDAAEKIGITIVT